MVPWVIQYQLVQGESLIRVPISGGFGGRQVRAADASARRSAYRLVAGELVLDLRDLQLASQTVSIRATTVAGRILLLVPRGAARHVPAPTGARGGAPFRPTNDGGPGGGARGLPPEGADGPG